jgi:8-oxo-dGTP diphosphatase
MINVTCAVIRNDADKVLVVQRGEGSSHPFKWEFPGGKLAPEETEEECIIREIEEELSMEIVICSKMAEVDHDYGNEHIRLIPFICDTLDEMPFLTEHIAYKWVEENELTAIDFSGADVIVAQNYLDRTKAEDLRISDSANKYVDCASVDADLQEIVNNLMGMKQAEWVATSAIDNPAIFLKLFEYSLSSNKNLAFRSSWTLTKVCDRFPDIIYPYLGQIIEALDKIENESTLRSLLRILSLSDLEKVTSKQHGLLTEFCFKILSSGFSAIAVKAYSMEILYRITLIYPEIANELSNSISILIEDGSAGITSRGRTILRKLANMPVKPRRQ